MLPSSLRCPGHRPQCKEWASPKGQQCRPRERDLPESVTCGPTSLTFPHPSTRYRAHGLSFPGRTERKQSILPLPDVNSNQEVQGNVVMRSGKPDGSGSPADGIRATDRHLASQRYWALEDTGFEGSNVLTALMKQRNCR